MRNNYYYITHEHVHPQMGGWLLGVYAYVCVCVLNITGPTSLMNICAAFDVAARQRVIAFAQQRANLDGFLSHTI
jgi:hypothetical protein